MSVDPWAGPQRVAADVAGHAAMAAALGLRIARITLYPVESCGLDAELPGAELTMTQLAAYAAAGPLAAMVLGLLPCMSLGQLAASAHPDGQALAACAGRGASLAEAEALARDAIGAIPLAAVAMSMAGPEVICGDPLTQLCALLRSGPDPWHPAEAEVST